MPTRVRSPRNHSGPKRALGWNLEAPNKTAAVPKERLIVALACICIALHLLLKFAIQGQQAWANIPLLVALVLGGGPLLLDLVREILKGQFGADLLAGLSIAVSILLGEYLAGSIVVLMLSGGTALENYASRRASAVLAALAKRMPSVAHKSTPNGLEDLDLSAVQIGDHLMVLPHEICPVDGVVLDGRGTMDESYLTGEPFQIAKVSGSEVLSGAINGESAMAISVSRLPSDSRYSKIMRVMQEAESNRPQMRRLADKLGAWFTPVGVVVAAIGWAVSGDSSRFLAVLVIATPCPLLLSIPIAIIGAVSVAASRGIIIKNPGVLEVIDTCRTVIFDKTGTLTYGKPTVTEILCAPGITRADALRYASSLEQYSKHPLAASVLESARFEAVAPVPVERISEKPGEGISALVDGTEVRLTGRKQVPRLQLPPQPTEGLECILLVDGSFAAAFHFHDAPRDDSKSFVSHLGPRHRVNKVMLVSGDRDAEVRHLAAQVAITDVLSGKSPEEKVEIVRAEAALAPTMFLGDGINDAPAMQAATVGIAFGQANEITAEAADAVILEPSLGKVDELIHIGRRMRQIALQSAIGGMVLSVVGMGAAAAGYLPPVAGAIAQEVIDVLAVLNALRVALPGGELRDFQGGAKQ